jgi:hypothetical protein
MFFNGNGNVNANLNPNVNGNVNLNLDYSYRFAVYSKTKENIEKQEKTMTTQVLFRFVWFYGVFVTTAKAVPWIIQINPNVNLNGSGDSPLAQRASADSATKRRRWCNGTVPPEITDLRHPIERCRSIRHLRTFIRVEKLSKIAHRSKVYLKV